MKRNCRIHPENGARCKQEYFASIKAKVVHSDTSRITFQRWDLCLEHYEEALDREMKGYYAWYKKKPFKKAHVIGYARMFDILG